MKDDSSRIREVSNELPSFTEVNHQPAARFERIDSAVANALNGLKFISTRKDGGAAWKAVAKRFDGLSKNGLLHSAHFAECIGMNRDSREFAGELFDALARGRNISGEMITKAQLREFWDQIADQSFDSRLQTFFDMVDKDGDGRITEEEIKEIIQLTASANRLSNIIKQADEYASLVMEELDPKNLGYIMIENLEMLLLQGPSQSVGGGGESPISSMKLGPIQDTFMSRRYKDFKYFLVDNWQRVWVMALWIGVMAALFTFKYTEYKHRAVFRVAGHCVCVAKGASETLKLNMALILLPVCRNTITWLRNKTKLGMAVPFDDNLNFHKVIAVAIAIGVGLHAISHLTCYFPRLIHATEEQYEPLEQFFGHQAENYWHFVKELVVVTGFIMVVLMTVAFTLAPPWFRRGRVYLSRPLRKLVGFNAFWYTHHLFVVVYICLIIHGVKVYLIHDWYRKTTWMYLAVPLTLYAGERLIRVFRPIMKPVKILKVVVYPGNVLVLHMSKPQGFKYKSGQYIFVNCPVVSALEWHPFSITTAPMDDYLSVHIRTLGDWTRNVKTVFAQACQPPRIGQDGLLRANCVQGENNPYLPRVLIDGPYGGSIDGYKDYDVVMLLGLGIGATPMISVVKDIVNNIKAQEEEENALEEGATMPPKASATGSGRHNFKTRRAYFYWVTREQGSFEWFKEVMNEVAELDYRRVIEIHSYCTSIYEDCDARSAFITMLQSLNHKKNGVDIVSGTRVMSHFAKPNWYAIYNRIARNHPNTRVGAFYCGAPVLERELRQLAREFSHKTSTRFDFHKENF